MKRKEDWKSLLQCSILCGGKGRKIEKAYYSAPFYAEARERRLEKLTSVLHFMRGQGKKDWKSLLQCSILCAGKGRKIEKAYSIAPFYTTRARERRLEQLTSVLHFIRGQGKEEKSCGGRN